VAPAAIGISAKTWSNLISNARAALVHFNLAKERANRRRDLSPAWRQIWEAQQATAQRSIGYALCNFVFFLSHMEIVPEDVRSEHLLAYREALRENDIRKYPDETFRKAATGWNRAVAVHDFWPRQTLTVPSRDRRIAPFMSELPESFAVDMEGYIKSLTQSDPLAINGRITPLRPATVLSHRQNTMRFAGVLIKAGVPAEEITNIAALASPMNAERGLRWMLTRNDNKTSNDIDNMASLLSLIGRDYLLLEGSDLSTLVGLAKKLAVPRQRGMTSKNRDRLRAVGDPKVLRKLLLLPQQLFARGEHKVLGNTTMLERENAIALAILQSCPIRRKNLVEIRLDQNLHRPGDGTVYLVFEEAETKTRRMIEFLLPEEIVQMIDTHVKTRSPALCPAGTVWLFPKRDGSGPIAYNLMSTKLSKQVYRELGLHFNMHLHRHLAAKIFLDDQPGAYEVVRRILGHSSTSTTLSAYIGFEAGTATRLYAEAVNRKRQE
jgi:integrase